MLDLLLVTIASVLAAQALPGPSLIAVASVALSHGRRPALLVASGVATGILIWTIVVALGLGQLLQVYPSMLTSLKLIGGGYLIWLGLRSYRTAKRGSSINIDFVGFERNSWVHFRRGSVVVLTNPAAALMWAAVASFLFGSGLTVWQLVGLSPVFAMATFVVYASYGVLFSTGVAIGTYQKFWRLTEVVFGFLFGTLGAILLISVLKEIEER